MRTGSFIFFTALVCALYAPRSASALSLSEAMALAAAHSEPAALAALDAASARAAEQVALGAVLPTASIGLTSVRNAEAVELGGSQFVALWDHTLAARASVDLFRGASIPTWAARRLGHDAAEERVLWQQAGLRVATARAYLGALTAREDLAAADTAIALRTASLDQVRALADGGFGVGSDVSRAELSLLEAESARVEAQRAVEDWMAQLAYLTNIDAVAASQLDMPELPAPTPHGTDTAALRALALNTSAAERLLRAQRLSFLPVLGLAGQYSIGAESLRAPDGRTWMVTFTATWDIFDYARYGRLNEAEVAVARAELQQSEAERQRETDIARAQTSLDAATQQLEIAHRALQAAQRTQALEAERFDGGDLTVFELVSADNDVFRAEISRNRAALAQAIATIELAFLQGLLEDDAWLSE